MSAEGQHSSQSSRGHESCPVPLYGDLGCSLGSLSHSTPWVILRMEVLALETTVLAMMMEPGHRIGGQ